MTPRWDWTWAGGNFAFSVALRFHCWKYCLCKNQQNGTLANGTNVRPYSTYPLWELMDTAARHIGVYVTRNGGVQFKAAVSSGQSSSKQILPDQSGDNPPAGSCGADGRQFCNEPWPSDIAGPTPTAPPLIPFTRSLATGASVGTCGTSRECSDSTDCGSNDACKCMIPDSQTAKQYGVDPIFPPSLCLTIAAFMMVGSSPGGKRDLILNQIARNADGERWRCVCNATYAATACCMVNDGIVF